MKKSKTISLISGLFIVAVSLMITGCDSTNSDGTTDTITIGLNLGVTGDSPEFGIEANKAAELFTETINAQGGVVINETAYKLRTVLEDNGITTNGAVSATQGLITEHKVMAVVGPNPSIAAIPSGEVANNTKTVLISPAATNPTVTLNRPYVFRVPFLDAFQGKVLAEFAFSQFSGTNACVLYASDDPYPSGLAESFKTEWEALNGTIAASETFTTDDEDLTPQLTAIRDAECGFLFLPQNSNEVPAIVKQAHEIGISVSILGADAWATQTLLNECGTDCEGYFLTKMFVADGAAGKAKNFVDQYTAAYGSAPGDAAALAHDALLLIEQGLKNCNTITGNLQTDRTCLRDGMAAIQNFEAVTGNTTFDENGDPQKCVFIVQIVDGKYTYYDTVCPA